MVISVICEGLWKVRGPSALIMNIGSSLDEETAAVSYTHDQWWRCLDNERTVLFVVHPLGCNCFC